MSRRSADPSRSISDPANRSTALRWWHVGSGVVGVAIAMSLFLLGSDRTYGAGSPQASQSARPATGAVAEHPAIGTRPSATASPSTAGASPTPIPGVIEAELVAVDAPHRTLTVRIPAPVARIEVIAVSPDAEITDGTGRALGLTELRPGKKLQALGTTTADGRFLAHVLTVADTGGS